MTTEAITIKSIITIVTAISTDRLELVERDDHHDDLDEEAGGGAGDGLADDGGHDGDEQIDWHDRRLSAFDCREEACRCVVRADDDNEAWFG